MNMLKVAVVFSLLQLIQAIVKHFLSYYQHADHSQSIFQKSSFFNSIDLLGIFMAIPLLFLPSLSRSLCICLGFSMVPPLATLYLIDRNWEYHQMLQASPNAQHKENLQFQHLLILYQFLFSILISASLTCLRIAMLTDLSLFMHERKISAIGFVQLLAVMSNQALSWIVHGHGRHATTSG